MRSENHYKAVLSVSVPPEQRERFYTSLAQFRQHAPFATKSALVVQAVIEAAEQERLLLEMLARLPQSIQIRQEGLGYAWQCPGGKGSAATALLAAQEALIALLSAPATEATQLGGGSNCDVAAPALDHLP
jgi:hypothetical protein